MGRLTPNSTGQAGQARSGIQNVLNLLDSRFRGNDKKGRNLTFYDAIIFSHIEKVIADKIVLIEMAATEKSVSPPNSFAIT